MDILLMGSADLTPPDRRGLRALLDQAFAGEFSDDDWEHALGGWHALIREAGLMTAHASVVPRRVYVGDRLLHAGYVEAVAVAPPRQRHGLGTAVMEIINARIDAEFELGVLSTGAWPFYERLGWERWIGPSSVRLPSGRLLRTREDDEGLMVRCCAATRDLDRSSPIACEARRGDHW